MVLVDTNDIKREALWALSNCTSKSEPKQFQELVNKGILRALTTCLYLNERKALSVALEGIANVLECGK